MKDRELKKIGAGFSAVIRAGKSRDGRANQFRLTLETHDRREAEQCLVAIERMRDALVKLGRGDEAELLMRKAGAFASDPANFAVVIAKTQVAAELPELVTANEFDTWGKLATAWCKGVLHERYPQDVPHKKTADTDETRIKHLSKHIGNVALVAFCKTDYWTAMRNLPQTTTRDTAERQFSQVVLKVMRIALKLDLIDRWPLDGIQLPAVDKRAKPIFTFLYPTEVASLLACPLVPFEFRVLWGFIVHEGLRISEVRRIMWHHIYRGVLHGHLRVDETKSGRALDFVLEPGVLAALDALRDRYPNGPFEWVTDSLANKAPAKLRQHLLLAGVDRSDLHRNDGRRRRLREHDLRATFVTLALLADRSESWITRHTGHTTSGQLQTYNHFKHTAEEMGFKPLPHLDVALGLGAVTVKVAPGDGPNGVGCDTGCDGQAFEGGPAPLVLNQSSMISASCARQGSNLHALRRWNLKTTIREQTAQITEVLPSSGVQEGSAFDGVSHHHVTPNQKAETISPVDALRAASRVAFDCGDWALVAELGKRIDAYAKPVATVTDLATRRRREEP